MRNSEQKKGFTFVELLIVCAIIALLATIVRVQVGNYKARARDAIRIADLEKIKGALELYFDDYGYYPPPPCGWDCGGQSGINASFYVSTNAYWSVLDDALRPYLGGPLPRDPINGRKKGDPISAQGCRPWTGTENEECFSYAYGTVGRFVYPPQYDLTAQLEDKKHPLRCGVKKWKHWFGANGYSDVVWCGGFTPQIYEASD